MDWEAWGIAPPVKINPLRGLPIHGLEAWAGLGVGRRPIPSLQVAEHLLNVPPGELGRDVLTHFLRPGVPVGT
jgi:hypothetical protein